VLGGQQQAGLLVPRPPDPVQDPGRQSAAGPRRGRVVVQRGQEVGPLLQEVLAVRSDLVHSRVGGCRCRHDETSRAGIRSGAVQGEYVGEAADKAKWGVEVVAKGDGKFVVNLLPGGLRGEGGDYSKAVTGAGKTEGDKTSVAGKDDKWSAVIADGKITGKTPD